MPSKIHIIVIYRGYFKFEDKRIGLEELQERETCLVMKESSDPLLKFEDYNCAGRNRPYFRELVQNK